ncbi:hypothetical protein PRZ48_012968 [Zasmidium cellare]|uniref:SGNH hydrolase-type esterase domain-containing protein n=1 Tax=Zasmidium cellare TaxID=395010 RepID=A0ABR0E336_ZASCE|nr:hypothetical protein PRZ48_012968 [Zasmidium cellare]
MSAQLNRPSRLIIYIGAIAAVILLFRFFKVTVPEPPPGSLGSPGKPPKPVAPGIDLRILPLGDSITYGDGGSDGNAYRLELRKALRIGGSNVDYIGSQTSGKENDDNQHEGWGGARISGVLERVLAQGTLRQKPNVILLMAGTNDLKEQASYAEPVDSAPNRLGVLIDAVTCECPDALLLVAKITGQRPLFANLRVGNFNAALEGVIKDRIAQGAKIKMVDQSAVAALELADDLHPNDAGYRTMAQNWLAGLQGAPLEWYQQPIEVGEHPPKTCNQEDSHWTDAMKNAPPAPPPPPPPQAPAGAPAGGAGAAAVPPPAAAAPPPPPGGAAPPPPAAAAAAPPPPAAAPPKPPARRRR